MLDGPTKQVRVTARPFRDSDLEYVEAVTMPARSGSRSGLPVNSIIELQNEPQNLPRPATK